jgi:hypothetical protein
MDRAEEAIGRAKPPVAHRSRAAKHKFFIAVLKIYSCIPNGSADLDACRRPHVTFRMFLEMINPF